MKLAAFIVGPVLLVAICAVVLWANMPTTKLRVHAVSAVDARVSRVFSPERVEHWPMWDFAITNAGRASAKWIAYLHFRCGNAEWVDTSAWNIDPPAGLLANGVSTTIKVGVPPNSSTNWVLIVKYWPETTPLEKMLSGWLKPVPLLRRLLPNSGEHFAADVWRSGTNVITAR